VPGGRLDLRDRVCLVTGAGRGIGLATARELEAAGASLRERAVALGADVTDADAMEGAVAAALERFGALDVVVTNAGIERVGTVRQPIAR
jgi:NAD(P)-dependent dehydrogenase (short-subunit alcohol dehydrogenase family)